MVGGRWHVAARLRGEPDAVERHPCAPVFETVIAAADEARRRAGAVDEQVGFDAAPIIEQKRLYSLACRVDIGDLARNDFDIGGLGLPSESRAIQLRVEPQAILKTGAKKFRIACWVHELACPGQRGAYRISIVVEHVTGLAGTAPDLVE